MTALTLATQTVGGAHSDGGFVEVDATNAPGLYRLDLSDAIVAAGEDGGVLYLHGATNMAPTVLRFTLEDKVAVTDVVSNGPITTDGAGNISGTVGGVDGDVTGTVGELAAQAKADINAEVLDVLSVDTFADLSATPTTPCTLKDAVVYLLMLAKNKLDDDNLTGTQQLYAANGSTVVSEATVSTVGDVTTRSAMVDP
jgi:hypothetical protein